MYDTKYPKKNNGIHKSSGTRLTGLNSPTRSEIFLYSSSDNALMNCSWTVISRSCWPPRLSCMEAPTGLLGTLVWLIRLTTKSGPQRSRTRPATNDPPISSLMRKLAGSPRSRGEPYNGCQNSQCHCDEAFVYIRSHRYAPECCITV